MSPLHILIIEDEIITANDIQETLLKAGHSVIITARNVSQAQAAVREQLPDIALVDIHLGDGVVDGITIVKELLGYHQIPVIYLTANDEDDTFARAKETRPAAYLIKPFRHRELALQVELAYHHFQANRHGVAHPAAAHELFLPIGKGHEKITKQEIVYIRASGAYSLIYRKHSVSPETVAMNLTYLAQFLPTPNFYRLSRSLLVNLNHLQRIEGSSLFLANYEAPLPIPEGGRKELLARLPLVRTA